MPREKVHFGGRNVIPNRRHSAPRCATNESNAHMSGACDYCSTAKALVFCRADSARLCLACDAQVRTWMRPPARKSALRVRPVGGRVTALRPRLDTCYASTFCGVRWDWCLHIRASPVMDAPGDEA